MTVPLVTTIVPCYKQAHYLPVALASMEAQTLTDWECIIVNDGSPDNTAEVAEHRTRKDARFRYVEQSNGGLSSARNAGLREARGEFVHFLDADDFVSPEFLSVALKALKEEPTAALAFAGWVLVDETGSPLSQDEVPLIAGDWFHFMLERCLCPCHAIVTRRCVMQRAGKFDEDLKSAEDWDMWLRIASLEPHFVRVNSHGAYYRQHNQSMSWNFKRMLKSGLGVIRKHAKAHGNCSACTEALQRGEANLSEYVWNISQRDKMEQYWSRGQFGRYFWSTISFVSVERRWVRKGLSRLAHSKRHIVNSLWKRLRKSVTCIPQG
jgi:glycosyltransferase involved in cell wall biosynthesis